jgi:hypothetical protein
MEVQVVVLVERVLEQEVLVIVHLLHHHKEIMEEVLLAEVPEAVAAVAVPAELVRVELQVEGVLEETELHHQSLVLLY